MILLDHNEGTRECNAKLDKAVSEKKQCEKDLQNERERTKSL